MNIKTKFIALMMAMLTFFAVSVNALPVIVNLQVGYVDPTENQEGPLLANPVYPLAVCQV